MSLKDLKIDYPKLRIVQKFHVFKIPCVLHTYECLEDSFRIIKCHLFTGASLDSVWEQFQSLKLGDCIVFDGFPSRVYEINYFNEWYENDRDRDEHFISFEMKGRIRKDLICDGMDRKNVRISDSDDVNAEEWNLMSTDDEDDIDFEDWVHRVGYLHQDEKLEEMFIKHNTLIDILQRCTNAPP
jgi:hypothetical protein